MQFLFCFLLQAKHSLKGIGRWGFFTVFTSDLCGLRKVNATCITKQLLPEKKKCWLCFFLVYIYSLTFKMNEIKTRRKPSAFCAFDYSTA